METKLRIAISLHCIDRYKERLNKEHLPTATAKAEIEALMEFAEVLESAPEWLNEAQKNEYGKHHCYVVVESLAFPARRTNRGNFLLLSCITRGSISPERRKARNKYKHIKRSKRGAGLRRWNGR